MYQGNRVAAVIPAYNEERHIGAVLEGLSDLVDTIVVVDDCSTDDTAGVVTEVARRDPRVTLIRHGRNEGVGAARVSGMKHVLAAENADIIVNLDGDDQMDTSMLGVLLDPIVQGRADFSKGNRFYTTTSFEGMPPERIVGNIGTTFATKLATGYWSTFDPQNGFTALRVSTVARIDLDSLSRDYAYENDFIGRLALIRARIADVDIPARYGSEVSSIDPVKVIPSISRVLWRTFWRRFWLTHVVRSFSPVALFVFLGSPLLAFSLIFGTTVVVRAWGPGVVSAANATLTSLTFTVGFMLLLAAMVIDVLNEPR